MRTRAQHDCSGPGKYPHRAFHLHHPGEPLLDNYFGTFPGANGIPAGTLLPDEPGAPLVNAPFLATKPTIPADLIHTWQAAAVAYDNGAMDGFLWAEWRQALEYYGKDIIVPKPNPELVKIIKKRSQRAGFKVRPSFGMIMAVFTIMSRRLKLMNTVMVFGSRPWLFHPIHAVG